MFWINAESLAKVLRIKRDGPMRLLTRALWCAALLIFAFHVAPGLSRGADEPQRPDSLWMREHLKHGTPVVSVADGTLIVREGYALLHDNERQIPLWVAYRLDPKDLMRDVKRTDNFREDPMLRGNRAEPADYRGSGYSRGHMAPAADMKKSAQVMSESFYLSNIVPQRRELNEGPWAELEKQIRRWLPERQQLWVYTGPAFDPNKERAVIGDGVAVPTHFWKIIIDERADQSISAIAFLLPNSAQAGPYQQSVITVDAIELATGIDFFPDLPDEIEEAAESRVVFAHWREPEIRRADPPRSTTARRPSEQRKSNVPSVRRQAPSTGPTRTRVPVPAQPITKRLRRGEQFTFGGVRIRLLRVDEQNPNDRKDDIAELSIVSGTRAQQIHLEELTTIFIENIEITAEEVQPSRRPGEGFARIVVRWRGR